MSRELLDRSEDLRKLRDEGFEIAVRSGYVIMSNVPYVNAKKEVKRATLVAKLVDAGNIAGPPDNHVMYFSGEFPCRSSGEPFNNLGGPGQPQRLGDVEVNFAFSQKPADTGRYENYYEKFVQYVEIFENEANAIDDSVTAKTFRNMESDGEDPIYNYPDTNSSRAEILPITDKLRNYKIGIIGVGGTGSYVLDFIAKTPVSEIHLFDKDNFYTHNAFRSPGAPSIEELNSQVKKVAHFAGIYLKMRKNVIPHDHNIEENNLSELDALNFVFICIDKGSIKKLIIDHLEKNKVSFIDVGMGLEVVNDAISGILRTTTSTERKRDHIQSKGLISFEDVDEEAVYDSNIQIAELNSFNAAMAVIKWKKLCGFYIDLVHEHNTVYSIDDNLYHHEDET